MYCIFIGFTGIEVERVSDVLFGEIFAVLYYLFLSLYI